ncbi:unnamed protein product, partial [Prorocentrum cordatum]
PFPPPLSLPSSSSVPAPFGSPPGISRTTSREDPSPRAGWPADSSRCAPFRLSALPGCAPGLQLMDGELDWGGLRRCATRGAEATALGRQRPAERGLNEHAAVGGCQPFGGPLAERPGGTASRALARVGAVGPGQGADVPEPDQLEALHLAGDAHPGDHRADEPDPLSAPPVPLAPDPPAAHDLVSPSSPGLRTSSAVPPLLPRSLAPSLSSGRLPRERREAPPPAARRPRRQQAARWALRNGER